MLKQILFIDGWILLMCLILSWMASIYSYIGNYKLISLFAQEPSNQKLEYDYVDPKVRAMLHIVNIINIWLLLMLCLDTVESLY